MSGNMIPLPPPLSLPDTLFEICNAGAGAEAEAEAMITAFVTRAYSGTPPVASRVCEKTRASRRPGRNRLELQVDADVYDEVGP